MSWIGPAISLIGGIFGGKSSKDDKKDAQKQVEKSDPYGKYRDEMAQKLNALVNDPSGIVNTAEYKARQTAASRLMAAQGYTGSGNAVAAAAEAGGQSYQQNFDNMARLAGVDAQPGGSNAALANLSSARDTKSSSISNITNNAVDLANSLWK